MTSQLALGLTTEAICDGCGRPEPIAYDNDNGRFCADCSAQALAWPPPPCVHHTPED